MGGKMSRDSKNKLLIDIPKDDELTASLSRENVKSLLYMIAGKPDSNIKLFSEIVQIQPQDIIDLNDKIQEKLKNHDIEAAITSVNITYKNNEIEQFNIWDEFLNHKWNVQKETNSITLKWDFLIRIPSYPIPQRHTVIVKVSSKLTPMHLLHALFSDDPEAIENLENETAPIVCRIDFINHVLNDELMQIVENWQKTLKMPLDDIPHIKLFKKNKTKIARIIHYSIPLFISFVAAGILNKFILINTSLLNKPITVETMKYFMYWLLGSCIAIMFMTQIGKSIANRVYQAIKEYGDFSVFNFTKGDKNHIDKLENKNERALKKIYNDLLIPLLINIISSIIIYYLF